MVVYVLKLSNVEMPIANSKEIGITVQLSDFRDITEARRRTISTTLEVYGNDDINSLLFSIFDIRTSGNPYTFDFLKRVPCELYENQAKFLDGFIILRKIIYRSGVYVYSFFFSTNDIGKLKLLDETWLNSLNLSKYNHVLNAGNIIDTWNGYNYVNGQRVSKPNGAGYIYSVGFYGSTTQINATNKETQPTNRFNSWKLLPFFHVKELFYELFKAIGIDAVVSIDDDHWDNLLISGDYEQLSNQIEGLAIEKTCKITFSTQNALKNLMHSAVGNGHFFGSTVKLSELTYTEQQDDDNNQSAGIYTCTRAGKLTISSVLDLRITTDTKLYNFMFALKLKKNGANMISQTIIGLQTIDVGTISVDNAYETSVDVGIGDVIELEFITTYQSTQIGSVEVIMNSSETRYTLAYTSYLSGETVNMNNWLPRMKGIDFVKGVVQLFNLYISEIDNSQITFRQRKDFYEGYEKAVNIDNYIDYNHEIEVTPAVIEANIKELSIKYSNPDDYPNQFLRNTYGIEWGAKELLINTDVCTERKEIKLPFSLIMPNEIEGYNIAYSTVFNFSNNKYEKAKFAPILAYYNGLMSGSITIIDYNGNNYSATTNSYYPLFTPNYWKSLGGGQYKTFSLYFEPPKRVLYSSGNVVETTNTLFINYHLDDINNLVSVDSRLIKLSVSPEVFGKFDVLQLLRKRITYNGAVCIINKIVNYNKNNGSIELELLKDLNIKRNITPTIPIFIPNVKPMGNTSTLKLASLGSSGVESNEIYLDNEKGTLCVGSNPVIIGRKEFYGLISQSGTNNPELTSIRSNFTPVITRTSAGVYQMSGHYLVIIHLNSKAQTRPVIYYDGYYTIIDTAIDGILDNNLILIQQLM